MIINEVTYQCTKCGATDRNDLLDVHEMPPPALNCYKCHAGLGVDQRKMVENRIGMFPVSSQIVDTNAKVEAPKLKVARKVKELVN